MQIEADFSEVADVNPGEYSVRVVEAKPGEYKTGTKFAAWTLEIFGQEDPALNGQKIYHRTPISGRGAGFYKSFYAAAMGIAKNEVPESSDATELYGKSLTVNTDWGKDQAGNVTDFLEVKKLRHLAA